MNWIFFLSAAFSCIVICNGQYSQDDPSCDCASDDVKQDCQCDQYDDGYKERLYLIITFSVSVVVVLAIFIGCCVYNKKWKRTWTKDKQAQVVEVNKDSKELLPHELTWTTLPSTSPPYKCTTLPYYHPESRDTTLSPPPPYMYTKY